MVEFCLARYEWLVAYNTVARLCYTWCWKYARRCLFARPDSSQTMAL